MLLINYFQDFQNYIKFAFDFNEKKTKRHHESDLIFFYHKVEKALSLPYPRPGFGKETINHLVVILQDYINKYGGDNIAKAAANSLDSYQAFNLQNNHIDQILNDEIEKINFQLKDNKYTAGGIVGISKDDINNSLMDFKKFANSRFSIRNFAEGEIANTLIEEAIEIAQKTPSVCNRQSSRVYIYEDEEKKSEILKFQNGNSGFGKDANKILIVTSDLRDFRGVNERHQSYIDGGMYSMSLIYALHSKGLGTCPLNLSLSNKTENNLKKAANINESEILLMMIAVGRLPEKLNVAASPRRSAREVMTFYPRKIQ